MIVTLTPNTTIDQTLFVPALTLGRTIRATSAILSMGGKPTDASWILGELGTSSLALGFAAGPMRAKVEALLSARGVLHDFVTCDGETRINIIIVVEGQPAQTTITTSTLEVTPDQRDQLMTRYSAALRGATCVVTGGTLPRGLTPSFYHEVIAQAKGRGLPVIFDADEPNLSAGLAARPDYIKPNEHELAALTGQPVDSLATAYAAGRSVLAQYGTSPIITLGALGGLAVLPDRAYYIPPLSVTVVSAAGAGDGVLAGLVWAVSQGKPIENGLRLGFACAAAICLMPGTADCRSEDVERLLPQVELIAYP